MANFSYDFYCVFTKSKLGATGLTVTANVYNSAGTKVLNGGAASEIGDGIYHMVYTGDDAYTYVCMFTTSDITVDSRICPSMIGKTTPIIVTNLDARISTRSAPSDIPTISDIQMVVPTASQNATATASVVPTLVQIQEIIPSVPSASQNATATASLVPSLAQIESILPTVPTAAETSDAVIAKLPDYPIAPTAIEISQQVKADLDIPTAAENASAHWNYVGGKFVDNPIPSLVEIQGAVPTLIEIQNLLAHISVDVTMPETFINDLWSFGSRTLTMTAQELSSYIQNQAGGILTCRRGDNYSATLVSIGALTGAKVWFTVKANRNDPDTAAVLMLTNVDGALVGGGIALADSSIGALTIQHGTDLFIQLDASLTAMFPVKSGMVWDIQTLENGEVHTIREGVFNCIADITRATE